MNITDKNFFDSGTSMGLLTCGLSEDALAGLCREAVRQKKSSVWVFPNMIENARRGLEQSGVSLGTVVSYPLGMDCPEVKIAETEDAADRGATDICVTFNAGAFKSGDIHTMIRELKGCADMAHGKGAKMYLLIETPLITGQQAEDVRILAEGLGADGIVSSPGWTW